MIAADDGSGCEGGTVQAIESCEKNYEKGQQKEQDAEVAAADAAPEKTTRDHELAIVDTVRIIKQEMVRLHIKGRITIDKVNNTIPGAERTGKGTPGEADIILWAGKNVYIWEVKSRGGNAKVNGAWMPNTVLGPVQLARYVSQLQKKINSETPEGEAPAVVQAGFGLPSSKVPNATKSGQSLSIWSGKPDDGEQGIRYYAYNKLSKKQQQQQQEQENPAPAPAQQPCGAGGGVVALGNCGGVPYTSPDVNPMPQMNPFPWFGGVTDPVIA